MKKKDYNYFEAFEKNASYAVASSELLLNTIKAYPPADMDAKVKEMHNIEHSADLEKHGMMEFLLKDFLPPLEREDIISLSQKIDDVTDAVEDVMIHLNIYNVQKITKELEDFAQLVNECCITMEKTLTEFKTFKKSKNLRSMLVEINRLEEEGDGLYALGTKKLFVECKDPIEIMTMTGIIDCFEKCCDAIEDVADDIESIVLKNT